MHQSNHYLYYNSKYKYFHIIYTCYLLFLKYVFYAYQAALFADSE